MILAFGSQQEVNWWTNLPSQRPVPWILTSSLCEFHNTIVRFFVHVCALNQNTWDSFMPHWAGGHLKRPLLPTSFSVSRDSLSRLACSHSSSAFCTLVFYWFFPRRLFLLNSCYPWTYPFGVRVFLIPGNSSVLQGTRIFLTPLLLPGGFTV